MDRNKKQVAIGPLVDNVYAAVVGGRALVDVELDQSRTDFRVADLGHATRHLSHVRELTTWVHVSANIATVQEWKPVDVQ